MREARRSAEVGQEQPDPGSPFIALARELQAEADRWIDDPAAGVDALAAAFDRLPVEARRRAAEATFERLPAPQRWAVLERLFGDDELRLALAHERTVARLEAAVVERRSALVEEVVVHGVLDTRHIPVGEALTLGLFRERDVHAARRTGRASTACARRIVVQSSAGDGALHVVEDVFNPLGGLFVTPEYDERAWLAERLDPHAVVRIGAIVDGRLDPVVVPGGRLDVEVAAVARPGRLHLGWALLGDDDLFRPTPPTVRPSAPPAEPPPTPPTEPASIGGNPT